VYQCQTSSSSNNSVLYNLKRATDAIRRASDHDVELIVFPELFLQGYDSSSNVQSAIAREGYELNVVAQLCQQFQVACIMPYAEKPHESETEAAATIFSSAALFHANGDRAGSYRKTTGEKSTLFSRGNPLVEALPMSLYLRCSSLKVGMLMGQDLWSSPEQCRYLARSGTQILAVAASFGNNKESTTVAERVARNVVPARALENGLPIICANYESTTPSNNGQNEFVGLSSITSADGESLILAPASDFLVDRDGDEEEDPNNNGRVIIGVEGSSIIPCEGGEMYVSTVEMDNADDSNSQSFVDDSENMWTLSPKTKIDTSKGTSEEMKPTKSKKGFGIASPKVKLNKKPKRSK